MFTTNYSFPFELLTWNITNFESITLFRHPVLYGLAIYALFLIIIGTIGKLTSNVTKEHFYSHRKYFNYNHSSSS